MPTGDIVSHKEGQRLRLLDKKVHRRNQKNILARKGKAKRGREDEVGDNLIAENMVLLRKKGIRKASSEELKMAESCL